MMAFSDDPQVAEQQMHAIIFYLTTFGYIDGDFDLSEKEFVRDYIRKVIRHRVETARGKMDAALKSELITKYSSHFLEVFGEIDNGVKGLFTEAVANDEDQQTFVYQKLKLRCFEIFKSFDEGLTPKLKSVENARDQASLAAAVAATLTVIKSYKAKLKAANEKKLLIPSHYMSLMGILSTMQEILEGKQKTIDNTLIDRLI